MRRHRRGLSQSCAQVQPRLARSAGALFSLGHLLGQWLARVEARSAAATAHIAAAPFER